MWHALLSDASFYLLLTKFDDDLAARVRAQGCGCGGRLHLARYGRKPRGAMVELGPEYEWRWSFCCARQGCRKRATPRSVRFFGRRVYLGCSFVLVMAMSHGVSLRRAVRLHAELGVGLRTLRRWRQWWREVFVASALWRHGRARLAPPVDETDLPQALLLRFVGGVASERLLALLSFLSPLTSTSV